MLNQLKNKYATPELAGKAINALALISPLKAGKLGLEIFCTPREGRELTTKEMRFINGAETTVLPFEDYTINMYRWGTGDRKLMLAHGYESNTSRWRALVPLLLREGFQVVAFDAPAHGLSGGKTLNGVQYANASELVIQREKPFAVIGHSLGAMSTAWYFQRIDNIPIEKFIMMAAPSKLRTVMNYFFETLNLSPKAIAGLEKHFTQKIGFGIDAFTLEDYIKNCDVPGTIIHDQSDDIAPFAQAKAIHQSWKGSKLIATNGLGHYLQSGDVYRMILTELEI
jgi:pimeloyl-ACP methyl ester carboxylesterase